MGDSGSESSEHESEEIIPEAIREMARNVSLNLLPDKSKKFYTAAYNAFKKWRKENNSNSFCEEVFLPYFAQLSKKYVPSSMRAKYSMLKCTINAYDHIDINRYNSLTRFLKKNCKGYQPKKSLVFSKDNISKFLNEAPDDVYPCKKVALIFGIAGALRREELVNISVGDVRKLEDNVLLIQIYKTKNYVPRSFTITDALFYYCWKYMQARPESCQINRFFLRYSKGRCTDQAIGINKFAAMPKYIAEYLNLPHTKDFTGRSFRRTLATLLVDAGADLTTLQRHGGWKSATLAFGYIADSINNKKKICDQISNGINIHTRAKTNNVVSGERSDLDNAASTSGVTTTSKSKENRAVITPKTASTSTSKIFHNCKNSILSASESNQKNQEPNILQSVKNTNFSIPGDSNRASSETEKKQEPRKIQQEKPKFPCFYDLDVGLYIAGLADDNEPGQSCIFNNCNVTINGSNNTFIFTNCNVDNKAL